MKFLGRKFFQENLVKWVVNLVKMGSKLFFMKGVGTLIDTTHSLVQAFITSRLDYYYCNSLLSGTPCYLIQRLQKVQNKAARLVLKHYIPEVFQWIPECIHTAK